MCHNQKRKGEIIASPSIVLYEALAVVQLFVNCLCNLEHRNVV
jgi:hypothetical protein